MYRVCGRKNTMVQVDGVADDTTLLGGSVGRNFEL